jgi:PAS domain S-box-containing protein
VQTNQSREQQFLAVFQKITALTSMVLDHQKVMDTIVRSLPELLGIDACTIRLLDTSIHSFVLGAAHGVSLEYLSREIVDTEETMAMIQSGYPVFSAHVDEDPFLPFRDAASREGIKSVLTLPILFQGNLIGIMRLLSRTQKRFSSEEISFAMALAEHVGLAISHGRMFKEMEAQLIFLREIQGISALVNSTLDLETILQTMVERVAVTMNAKGCTLRLLDPATNKLELAASYGVSTEYLQRGEIENERNIKIVLAGEPVAIYDIRHDQRVDFQQQMAEEGICSLLAVPLQVNEEIIGAMRILSDVPRVFTDTEVQFSATLAGVGGAAIRNARNYRKIHLLLAQIKEHERFLANIINSLQHQVLVLDRHRKVVLANQVFLAAAGKEEAEVLGMDYSDFCQCFTGNACCPVDQILQEEKMMPLVQEWCSGDQQHWFERTALPIYEANGQIEYVIEIIRDITSEHMLEEEKIQSGKLQGIVELAGTVAHEINSPLFAALGTAQLLLEDSEQPEVVEELEVIIRNLKQISELTEKMSSMTGFISREYVGTNRILTLTKERQ